MAKITNEVVYKDFDLRFQAHPITGKLLIKKNAEAIKQAFKNLIMTNLYERRYRPLFGSSIGDQLFEHFTALTEENIRHAIETAAKNYENRVELIDIIFGGDPDGGELRVSIIFRPINSTTPAQLELSLSRVR